MPMRWHDSRHCTTCLLLHLLSIVTSSQEPPEVSFEHGRVLMHNIQNSYCKLRCVCAGEWLWEKALVGANRTKAASSVRHP